MQRGDKVQVQVQVHQPLFMLKLYCDLLDFIMNYQTLLASDTMAIKQDLFVR